MCIRIRLRICKRICICIRKCVCTYVYDPDPEPYSDKMSEPSSNFPVPQPCPSGNNAVSPSILGFEIRLLTPTCINVHPTIGGVRDY